MTVYVADSEDIPAFWAAARARAAALDAADPLAALRARFHLPDGVIYLDGNSLGPTPKAAFAEIETAARQEWAEGLIRSWNAEDWFDLPQLYGDRLAPLVGAGAGEVVVCDTASRSISTRPCSRRWRCAPVVASSLPRPAASTPTATLPRG